MRAHGESAAWQALCDYDDAHGVPLPAFIHGRVFASALTRYRQEWRYALRCVWPADQERASITEAKSYLDVLHELLAHALAHLPERERRLIQQL
jgi:DNA-directed RNA polymerase specialized sigma24 family protein